MTELAQLPLDHPWMTVGVLAVLLLVLVLLGRRRPRAGGPQAGDVWFAEVPFEDGSGSKDRPVLVLSASGRSCEVARFTSQDKNGRRDHVRVPQGVPGLPKASWLNLRPTSLPRSAFRRRTGQPGEAFVAWYRDAADNRV
ncbi:type II toxin-antitoxin system PemK/MazF family toxin [Cellulomonas sp. Root485]|uniref:type II toxin-antitoxin system PemK/MazF family toxin n=1 Tax=Cellulomonas sp. Root485 TaxID=1736546 RepID=UPI000ADAE548|nr:type II toxin-antitoxin system PemK/MazF family toxin [Cellulomonas sp. Root485]